jgi:hypothetical protein
MENNKSIKSKILYERDNNINHIHLLEKKLSVKKKYQSASLNYVKIEKKSTTSKKYSHPDNTIKRIKRITAPIVISSPKDEIDISNKHISNKLQLNYNTTLPTRARRDDPDRDDNPDKRDDPNKRDDPDRPPCIIDKIKRLPTQKYITIIPNNGSRRKK